MPEPADVIFRDVFPMDLWRGGGEHEDGLLELRVPPHPRPDVKPYPVIVDGVVTPTAAPLAEGLSLWDGPHPAVKRGWWWVIPKDTPLPPGLVLVPAAYLSKGRRHYLIAPEKPMALPVFQALLNRLKKHAKRQYVIA